MDLKFKKGRATDEEEENFAKDVPVMAKVQVDSFDNRSAEKNKQQLHKEIMTLFDPKANGNISPARAFIETTKQTYELGVQYVSAIQGYGGYYNAFVIKLPRIESGHAPYKLFVRESSQYS